MKTKKSKQNTSSCLSENSSDLISYFLLNNKNYKWSILISGIVAILLLILFHLLWANDPNELFNVKNFFLRTSFSVLVVMLVTSLSGYGIGAVSVFIYFSIIVMKVGFDYCCIMFLIASLLSNLPIMLRLYKSFWTSLLVAIIFAFIIGTGTTCLILFLFDVNINQFALEMHVKNTFVLVTLVFPLIFLIPSLIVSIFCYEFFNCFPEKVRKVFFVNSYTSEEVLKVKKELRKSKSKRDSSLEVKLFYLFTFEAISLLVASFGFSSGLIGTMKGSATNEMILYITRFFFLMLLVAVPLVLLIISWAEIMIINPITLMAKAVEDSSSPEQDKSGKKNDLIDIHSLKIKSRDEIGILYNSLVTANDNAQKYLERMQREQELQKELEIAEAATKAKSAFLSNMSHEIRTPINAVLGLDEMILRESQENETLHYAQDIQNAGKSLLSLVNDILDFSKIESGKMEIIPYEYDLTSTINDLVNMISKRAEDKGLLLNINVDENLPHILYGDEIRIKQCIINILTNAVKYTEKGSVSLSFNFEKQNENEINLIVHVKDTGIGIKTEDMDKLFVAFQRIEEKRNRTIEGTGLGMNIVQQLLNLMGSHLNVESVYGKGSDFYFNVKQSVVNWEPIGDFNLAYKKFQESSIQINQNGLFTAPNAQILVVDDTPLNLTVIKGLLKRTKINVETAASGKETLELVVQKKYDVIFIDHRMPIMDGIETLEAMKTLKENKNLKTPCIALTANAVKGAREMYLEAGFTDYLTKPIDSKKLEKMLIEYLPKEKVIKTQAFAKKIGGLARESGDFAKKSGSSAAGTDSSAAKTGGFSQESGNFVEKTDGFSQESAAEKKSISENSISKDKTENRENNFLSKLSKIEGLDVNAALKNCGDSEVLFDATKEFARSIKEKSAEIENYQKNGDIKNYTILVHALKSSARLIGISKLSELAANLEKCGDKNQLNEINQKTPELLELYKSYEEKLKNAVGENLQNQNQQTKNQISLSEYKDALSNLKECIEAFDFDTADQIVSMLDEYEIPADEKNHFEEIKKQIAKVDQAATLALL